MNVQYYSNENIKTENNYIPLDLEFWYKMCLIVMIINTITKNTLMVLKNNFNFIYEKHNFLIF